MRKNSHTVIATLRQAVRVWRKRMGWSRETVTQAFVETFNALDGEAVTGLRFGGSTADLYERTKIDADRLFRWLDDEGKDNNLLPASMIPFLLAALPVDLRILAAAEILLPSGLSVHVINQPESIDLINALQHVAKESGEATSALAGLVDGVSPGELDNAARELVEAIHASQEALAMIDARRSAGVNPLKSVA